MSQCRVCRGPVIIDLPRHNANFCAEHLQQPCRRHVEKAIADHDMLSPGEQVLVAVSGGKDSLALGDLLLDLGYQADGLYLGLGTGTFSEESTAFAQRFADERRLSHKRIDLREDHGYDVATATRAWRLVPRSACGLSKRRLFDEALRAGGYRTIATGHNLDDEAAVRLGNTLRSDVDALTRQMPVLPDRHGFQRKVKPLVRLTERETAAWCVVHGIDYQVEECPLAAGNPHLDYKATINEPEARSPGAKASAYVGFLGRTGPQLASHRQAEVGLRSCTRCGTPTSGDVYAPCRLVAAAHELEPVELLSGQRSVAVNLAFVQSRPSVGASAHKRNCRP